VRGLAVLTSLLAGCGRIGFGGTALAIQVRALSGVTITDGDARVAFPDLDPDRLYGLVAEGGAVPLPATVVIGLPDQSGSANVTVDAHDQRGRPLVGTASTYASAGDETEVTVVLGAGELATCNDGVRDGDETDIDCGGAVCPACGLGGSCMVDGDCASNGCANGACEPVSGPPSWLPAAAMPLPRLGAGAELGSDGRIYIFGGAITDTVPEYTEVDVYVPATNTWELGPAIPTPRQRIGAALDSSGTIYAIGGETPALTFLTVVETLIPGASAWQTAPSLPAAAGFIAATHDANGAVAYFGGQPTLTIAEQLDGSTWSALPALTVQRADAAASLGTDGRMYAIGGRDSNGFLTSVIAYDASAGWTTVASLNTSRSDLAAVTGPDGRLYAIGGYDGTMGIPVVEASRVDAAGWVTVASLSTGRDAGMAAVSADGRIFAFGGRQAPGNAQSSVDAYGPTLLLPVAMTSEGGTLVVTGANFAANATVRFYLDGAALELATTDANGAVAATSLTMPEQAVSGAHSLRAIDDHSEYPVTYSITID
jgi:hypothetical protein